jgi:hypothetical protein
MADIFENYFAVTCSMNMTIEGCFNDLLYADVLAVHGEVQVPPALHDVNLPARRPASIPKIKKIVKLCQQLI